MLLTSIYLLQPIHDTTFHLNWLIPCLKCLLITDETEISKTFCKKTRAHFLEENISHNLCEVGGGDCEVCGLHILKNKHL